jgi:glutaredoxin
MRISYFIKRNYEEEESQKIVIYTTTLQIVRMSYDKCKKVKKILQNHCVRYEEKDLYKNKEFQRELKYRLNLKQIDVPHVFFNGKHIGVRF